MRDGTGKILRVAAREYKAVVRTKGFIIGLILAPVLMGGSGIAFALLKGRIDTSDKRIAVIDRSGRLAAPLARAAEERNAREVLDAGTGKKIKPAYHVEVVPPAADPDPQRLALSDRVRRGEIHAFVEIDEKVVHPRRSPGGPLLRYHAKNPALDDVRRWIAWPVNDELRRIRLAEAGIDGSKIQDLFDWVEAAGLGLVSADAATGEIRAAERRGELEAIFIPIVPAMLLLLMLMMGAAPQLHSTMEEKSHRIAEVMLGSVTPFDFLMGKLIGGVSVSLTAAAVYIVGGIIAMEEMGFGRFIPYPILPWFCAYLVMASFFFGSIFAALGSACNDPSEAQSMMLPAMLPVILPMFVQMPIVQHPHSAFATGISLFPVFTPSAMLLRQGTPGGVPSWQPWVGLAGLAVFTLLSVWAGSRIFRVGILMQGNPPRLRAILRWAIRG